MNIEIANRLVQLRKAHGYSQESLAAALGISRQAVSKWERAESSPELENVLELARIYGITLDALLKGEAAAAPVEEADTTGQAEETEAGAYQKANAGYPEAKAVYEQAEDILQETDGYDAEQDACIDSSEEEDGSGSFRFSASLYIDDSENGKKGAWHAFPYPILTGILYLLAGFLFGKWLEGCLLFLTVPVYYSIANWFDGGKKGSFLTAVPYSVVTVIVYLVAGLFFDAWHPTWLVFLTIPLYYAAADATARRKK